MTYLVHAPGFGRPLLDGMAELGAALWLGMQAPKVRELRLGQCHQVFVQAQLAQTSVLVVSQHPGGWTPTLWLAYAALSPSHEAQYVRNPAQALPQDAWHSGDRLWLMHLVAHKTFTPEALGVVRDLFKGRTARTLSPRSHRFGQKVLICRGRGVRLSDARRYWQSRPILA